MSDGTDENKNRIGISIPFKRIWPTLGTPISDATEEKDWRKMLHRATFVRNRDPKAETHDCRLRCRCKDESMLHIVQCGKTKPFWKMVFRFIKDVFGEEPPINIPTAVIFNIDNLVDMTLYSIGARAFIRHAFSCFYKDFAKVSLDGKQFIPMYTQNG